LEQLALPAQVPEPLRLFTPQQLMAELVDTPHLTQTHAKLLEGLAVRKQSRMALDQ
jgi:hypothetical protein